MQALAALTRLAYTGLEMGVALGLLGSALALALRLGGSTAPPASRRA